MILSRRLRRWVTGGLLMAMLFMQLATAAYACPALAQARSALQAMPDMSNMPAMLEMPNMQDCAAMGEAGLDEALPLLCKAHCSTDATSTASAAAPDLQPNPAATTLLLGIVWPAPAAPLALAAPGQPRTPLRPPSAPPLYLLVLRT
jgi:hypothetical protein